MDRRCPSRADGNVPCRSTTGKVPDITLPSRGRPGMVWFASMIWFWLGFFALVALLLFLDLGVLHRRAAEPSLRSAVGWTLGWICLGLSFSGVVYLIYEHAWLGAQMAVAPGRGHAIHTPGGGGGGSDAAI